MAETPSIQSPARTQPQSGSDLESAQYWCYHCDKRVNVETLPDLPDIVCHDCKNGFVESIAAVPTPAADPLNDPALGNQFIQVLRLIAQAAREDDSPSTLPFDPSDDDYLHIEVDGWDNDNDDDEDDDDVEDEDEDEEHSVGEHSIEELSVEEHSIEELSVEEHSIEEHSIEEISVEEHSIEEHSVEVTIEEEDDDSLEENSNRSDGEEDEDGVEVEVIEQPRGEDEEEAATEEDMRRRRRDVLRLQLRDFTSRATSRRNRILDWAEILMGLEDHSIELRLQVPESDTYVGNPGDYVDAAEYEALLQNLAESDSGARRGAPPASKVAVEGLESVFIEKEESVMGCAICKDVVNVGEIAKKMPCGHGYHGECIVPWLGSRNTCPVCRFELPTDDLEYEEDRKKRVVVAGLRAASSGGSSSGGGGAHDSGLE